MITAGGGFRPIAPQAFAETSPQFYSSYFMPKTGLQLATSFVTYGVMYQVQPWVFTVVNKIANLIARLGVTVWDNTDPHKLIADDSSPYARLMGDPCYTIDTYTFWHWLTTTIEIYGEAYLIKDRDPDTKRITSLIPMHPTMTSIHREKDGTVLYRFMGRPNELYPETDVVPFRSYNPMNTMRGLSRLEPLRLTLMNEDSARRAQTAWWNNMGRPSMVLSTNKKLGSDGRERVQKGFEAAYGGADNAGGMMLLEDEITATKIQLTGEEMQYIDSRRLNREEVCAVYDIAPPAVRILDRATDANLESQFRDVYKDTAQPRIQFIQSVLDYHVGSEFYGKKELRFNLASQLRGDLDRLVPAMVQLIQSGMAEPDEMRGWIDLPAKGGVASKLYANQALQPLGSSSVKFNETGALNPPGMKPDNSPPPGSATAGPHQVAVIPSASGSLPNRVPSLTEKAVKYRNDIGAEIGRGKSWQDAAAKLMDRNPLDRTDIQMACLDILERNSSTAA